MPLVLHQILTRKLNLSPAITFKTMEGPIFWSLPLTSATSSLGEVMLSVLQQTN